MLNELSKKDKLWRSIAFKICGDKSLADDLVQEMYLRRYENDRGQELRESYIASTLRSIYLNRIKTNKLVCVEKVYDNRETDTKYEITDDDYYILEKAKQLPFKKRELLELNYDYSLREIQDMFQINYGYVYKLTKQAREFILGKDLDKYENKRLKHKKMAKSKGLGDTIAKVTKATGIEFVVKKVVGDDCGCEERKKKLNELWHYKFKPLCLTEAQIEEYARFIDTRSITLLGGGKAKGRLQVDEINYVCSFYAIVFQRQEWFPTCYDCMGTVKTLIDMIYKLETVYFNNIPTDVEEEIVEVVKPKKSPAKKTSKPKRNSKGQYEKKR